MRPGLENRNQSAEQVLDIIMRHAPESQFVNVSNFSNFNNVLILTFINQFINFIHI